MSLPYNERIRISERGLSDIESGHARPSARHNTNTIAITNTNTNYYNANTNTNTSNTNTNTNTINGTSNVIEVSRIAPLATVHSSIRRTGEHYGDSNTNNNNSDIGLPHSHSLECGCHCSPPAIHNDHDPEHVFVLVFAL